MPWDKTLHDFCEAPAWCRKTRLMWYACACVANWHVCVWRVRDPMQCARECVIRCVITGTCAGSEYVYDECLIRVCVWRVHDPNMCMTSAWSDAVCTRIAPMNTCVSLYRVRVPHVLNMCKCAFVLELTTDVGEGVKKPPACVAAFEKVLIVRQRFVSHILQNYWYLVFYRATYFAHTR